MADTINIPLRHKDRKLSRISTAGEYKAGTWVSLRKTILPPEERAAGIPADTAAVPVIMWVNGFLEHDAAVGEEAVVRTRMNRAESGVVEEVNPTTSVDYGEFVPEIMEIGTRARRMLFGGGADG